MSCKRFEPKKIRKEQKRGQKETQNDLLNKDEKDSKQ